MRIQRMAFLAMLVLGFPGGHAANRAGVNEANNPLTAKITVNLQDQHAGSYYGLRDSELVLAARGDAAQTVWLAADFARYGAGCDFA